MAVPYCETLDDAEADEFRRPGILVVGILRQADRSRLDVGVAAEDESMNDGRRGSGGWMLLDGSKPQTGGGGSRSLYTRLPLGTGRPVYSRKCVRNFLLGFRGWQGEAMLWWVGLSSVSLRRRSVFWCWLVAVLVVSVGVFSGICSSCRGWKSQTSSQSTVSDAVRRRMCLEAS